MTVREAVLELGRANLHDAVLLIPGEGCNDGGLQPALVVEVVWVWKETSPGGHVYYVEAEDYDPTHRLNPAGWTFEKVRAVVVRGYTP